MRLACASLGLVVACGGSHPSVPDGGVADGASDGASDAGADATPDGPSCTTPDDRDGDGVCDSLDVCPDVADPGQADLDGDGIGWMCDPVESVTLAGDGLMAFVQASIHEDTFAARTHIQCSGPPTCGHALVQVGAAGAVIARSDSMAAADAWQANSSTSWLDGPLVTPDDRVLWSRGYGSGDTGDYDLASHTFTTRANGVFNDDDIYRRNDVYAGAALEAVALTTAPDLLFQNLVEVRSDGTLPTIATAQGFYGETSAVSLAIPGTQTALVPVRASFADGLKLYTRGGGLTEVMAGGTPLTSLAELEILNVDGVPRGFCAQRGTQVYAVDWDAGGAVTTYLLPASSCMNVGATDRGAARIFYQGSSGWSVLGYSYAGTFHNMVTDGSGTLVGDTLPVLIPTVTSVWEIKADGSSVQLLTNVDSPIAAMSGDTINVLAHHMYASNNGYGDWVLHRFRTGQAAQAVTLVTNEVNGINASLATSVEGAALVTCDTAMTVPSQSMTPVPASYAAMRAGIRDGHTVVFAQNISGNGAVYEYTEVNGAPHFTMLDTTAPGIDGGFLGSTSWFMYEDGTGACHLARFTAGTLDSVGCTADYAMHVLGTRADGVMVASDSTNLYLLSASGAQRLGPTTGTTYGAAILDTSAQPPVLVGWSGSHAGQLFSCLATHPERCWAYPYVQGGTTLQTVASATDHNGDGSFQIILQQGPQMIGQVTLTIVRSIGPGTFTP